MRVLHVVASISEVDGGPGLAALEMCRALGAAGHEAVLATTDFDGPGRRLGGPKGEVFDRHGAQVIVFPMVGNSERRKPSPRLAKWLKQETATFDAVHIHGLYADSTQAAVKAARRSKVPYVMAPVGHLMMPNVTTRKLGNWPKNLYIYFVEAVNMSRASFLLFTSELELDLSLPGRAMEQSRAFVIPPCLGADAFAAAALASERAAKGKPHKPLQLGFLGRLHPIKGFEVWLPALGQLAAGGINFELHIAGPPTPWSEKNLAPLVKSCGLSDRTHFRPRLEGDERWPFLAELDLFLLLSKLENFGLAVVEAMACGTPVVLTDTVGCAEWIEDKEAGVVVSYEQGAMADAIGKLLAEPKKLRARGNAAAAVAKDCFSQSSVAHSLLALYGLSKAVEMGIL